MKINQKKMTERFLRYVQIDTQSDENSTTYPSTEKQLELLNPFELNNILQMKLKKIPRLW